MIKDNELNKIINRTTLNNAQIDFDKNGDIVKLINNEDISTKDKDRRDYTEDEKIQPIEYELKSIEDIQGIIDNIVNINDLQDYKIVDCHNQLIGTWNVTWNKILYDDIVNPYDVVNVCIDAKDGSITMFSKNSIIPNTIKTAITKDEAINYAQPIIEKIGCTENIAANLTVFKPNFYWEDGGPYEEADFVRQAWKITVDSQNIIMVDAETGEILGGSQTLADGARAMSLVPTFYNASERATVASEAFKRLGYIEPYGCQPHTGWVQKADVMWVINHSSLYRLFISCHGAQNPDGSFANAITDGKNWTLSASEITGNWHFVYLAGCLTSSNTSFSNAFNINNFGRAFVGNNNSLATTTSYNFIIRFFPKLGYMSVHSAVLEARSEAIAAGYTDCNPGFYGDLDYYGWSW